MISERWLPVPGWSCYEVSELGNVRSLDRWAARKGGSQVRLQGQPLRPNFDGLRYLQVTLSEAGKVSQQKIHCLVATAFLGPRPDGLEVHHFDGDSFNNSASNLYYGTPSENQADSIRHGTHPGASKTSCLRGHPFDEANTHRTPDGHRTCRACRAERERNRKRAIREARRAPKTSVKKGDLFTWSGVKIRVTRVHEFGDWADIKATDPSGFTWTKRQVLPFNPDFKPVTAGQNWGPQ